MPAFTCAIGHRHHWCAGLSTFHVAFTSTSRLALHFRPLFATSYFDPRLVYNTTATTCSQTKKFWYALCGVSTALHICASQVEFTSDFDPLAASFVQNHLN